MHHFRFTRGKPGIVKVRNSLSDTEQITERHHMETN